MPASGASIPGLDLEGLRWRVEVAHKGSAYDLKPGQILPGRRDPSMENEAKVVGFRSKREWRWSFWKKRADSKLRAHARPWRTLPQRKRRK